MILEVDFNAIPVVLIYRNAEFKDIGSYSDLPNNLTNQLLLLDTVVLYIFGAPTWNPSRAMWGAAPSGVGCKSTLVEEIQEGRGVLIVQCRFHLSGKTRGVYQTSQRKQTYDLRTGKP